MSGFEKIIGYSLILLVVCFILVLHFYLDNQTKVNHRKILPHWKHRQNSFQKNNNIIPTEISMIWYWKKTPDVALAADRSLFPSFPGRYLLFEKDLGGFNNIRMSFEYMVLLAILTGRTLVLPPPEKWYLMDWGQITRGGTPGQRSTFEDFFDMDDLQRIVPVITTKAWMDKNQNQIPSKFFSMDLSEDSNYRALKKWARESFPLMNINSEKVTFYYPHSHDATVWTEEKLQLSKEFLHDRKAIDLPESVWTENVIYFPCWVKLKQNINYRFLNQLGGIAAFGDNKQKTAFKRLMRYGIHYRPEVFMIANKVIKYIGRNTYDAIHIRRNELQYKESFLSAKEIISNIKVLLRDGKKLYIATDELDKEYFRPFEKRYNVIRWNDFWSTKTGNLLDGIDISPKIIGLIEQVICAGARLFVKTRHSTFSAYIVRLRGYMDAPNKYNYVHTHNYTANPNLDSNDPVFMGRDYMKEYREIWDIS